MSARSSRGFVTAVIALGLLVLVLAGSSATAANADGNKCRKVQGKITLQPPSPKCSIPPVGCRTTGTIKGGIKGTFEVVTTSALPSVDILSTGVGFTTAETKFTTSTGTLVSKDASTLSALTGEYVEIITIVAGTGSLEGATGTLTAAGVVDLISESGSGSYSGQICLP